MSRFKKMFLAAAILIVFVLITANFCFASTYYVSTSGSDSNNGSSSSPFRTIQHAADTVNPGDTVIVKNGTYTDLNGDGHIVYLNRSGISSAWIIFKAENVGGAVLDGQNNTAGYGWTFGPYAAYVKVDGFEVKGIKYTGFIQNNGGHDLYISHNNIHDIGRRIVPSGDYGTGQGIDIGDGNPYNITIDGNVIHTIGRFPSGSSYDYNNDHGIYLKSGSNLNVVNNLLYDLKAGWGVHIYGGTVNNINILNNTFADANPGRLGQILVYWYMTGINIKNNIFYKPNTCGILLDGGSTGVVSNNMSSPGVSVLCANPSSGFSIQNSWNGSDPLFVDPSSRNYHLQSGSPAIDKGLNVGYNWDGNRNTRVNAPDLGAYEYIADSGSSSGTDPTPVPDPIVTSPPTPPEPVFPGNGDKVPTSTQLKWKKSKDASGNSITYNVKVCKDRALTDCPTNGTVAQASPFYYAGFGGSAAGILLLGFAFFNGLRRRRKLALMAASLLLVSLLLVSCGGGGSGSSPSSSGSGEISYSVSGLSSNTNYYWQVTADNGQATSDSVIMNFVTE